MSLTSFYDLSLQVSSTPASVCSVVKAPTAALVSSTVVSSTVVPSTSAAVHCAVEASASTRAFQDIIGRVVYGLASWLAI